ncbi:MAG: ribonucleoside triphosphate reductase, partial [Lachnospiraceae bacterium]|nr:ribonucleoside triphosphate reductase [Lachnospiraceae bacterium]
RAVQNWNPGKQQEFSERLEYVIDADKLDRGIEAEAAPKQEEAPAVDPVAEVPVVNENGELLLFTTKTCPNCKLAKEFLAGMDYRVIDAEENAKLTMKYGVMQAPTLVVLKGENVEKYTNASNIRRFVSENK